MENAAWDLSTKTLSWTSSSNNLIDLPDLVGDWSEYTTIKLETSDLQGADSRFRLMVYFDGTPETITMYSAGNKDLNFTERSEFAGKDFSKVTQVRIGGSNSASGSVVISKVYLDGKPMSLNFDDKGMAEIDITDLTANGCYTFDDQTGVLTSSSATSWGSLKVNLPEGGVNLSNVTNIKFSFTGDDDIIGSLSIQDGETNVGGPWYSSKYDVDFSGCAANASHVTSFAWGAPYPTSKDGTMTINSIKLTADVITVSDPRETLLTDDMYFKWDGVGADANSTDAIDCAYGFGISTQNIYGDMDVNSENYADLSNFDELRLTVTEGAPRLLLNRAAGKGDYIEINPSKGQEYVSVNGTLWTIDLAAIKAVYGYVHLNCIKGANWANANVINPILYKASVSSPYSYILSGSGIKTASVLAALADETATAIDATGITKATALETANPNCLIVANEGMVTNAQNVIVGGTCANLVLTDKKPFKAPASFTATTATLNREVSNGGFATICAPFAITDATGTFYQPSELTAEGVLNFATEATPAAGKAYLFKASADVTAFTGSGTVVAEPVDNGEGVVMKGTFSQIAKVDEGSYILSGSSLYKVDSDVALAPFRAYFEVPAVAPARINLHFDDETTGIEAVNSSMNNVEGYYNLNGQRVAQTTKGLYIVNGKKVMVK